MDTDLRAIPGVGPRMEEELVALGIHRVQDLRGRDPEELYARMCTRQGGHVDRCVLYVLRCAVYFAEHEDHDPELLKWWRWKDAPETPPARGVRLATGAPSKLPSPPTR